MDRNDGSADDDQIGAGSLVAPIAAPGERGQTRCGSSHAGASGRKMPPIDRHRRARLQHYDGAQHLSVVHLVEGFFDVVDADAFGDEAIQW